MRLPLRWSRRLARMLPRRTIRCHTKAVPAGNPRVLVLGIYVGDKLHTADELAANFASTKLCRVEQRWACLRGTASTGAAGEFTRLSFDSYKPKWTVLTQLLELAPADHDFVIFCDDDIELGANFVDHFIALQQQYDFDLAQPARTWRSFTDWPIVRRAPFAIARQTRFVEAGPLTCMSRRFLKLALPFSDESPMGWGYDFVWSAIAERCGLKIGIIDATPVEHSMRPPNALYGKSEELERMFEFLARHEHTPMDAVHHAVHVFR